MRRDVQGKQATELQGANEGAISYYKSKPFSTGNVPNRYVGIKKSFPHYLFRQFLASFIFHFARKEGVPDGSVGVCGCVELFMGHICVVSSLNSSS